MTTLQPDMDAFYRSLCTSVVALRVRAHNSLPTTFLGPCEGTPEGVMPDPPSSLRFQFDGPALWFKTTPQGIKTGWINISSGGAPPDELFYIDASDYGFSPGGSANSASLNAAIVAATVLGERSRVYLPPGDYAMEATVQHQANVIVFGTGPNTILRFAAGVSAWDFANTFTRAELSYLQILGVFGAPAPIGINLNQSQHVYLHDMQIWDFAVGILISDGAVFSGYHVIGPNVEVNRCPVGIRALENANACRVVSSRIFFSYDATDTGIGIDVSSAQGLEVDGVQIEAADTCLRIRNTTGLLQINTHDCYLEPGTNPITTTVGQAYDVDVANLSDGIEEVYGRNNVVSALRGTVALPPDGFVEWQGYSRAFFGARFSGTAGPKRNYVYNGQLLYYGLPTILPGWGTAGSAPTLSESGTFVTGNRSLQAVATAANSTVTCGFTVSDDGVDFVTCGIRYQIIAGNAGFSFSGVVGANTRQYQPEPTPTGVWREAWVQVPVDPANRSGAISMIVDGSGGGGTILIDEVWAVPGRYATSSTQYAERIQTLPSPVPFFDRTVTGNDAFGPINLLTLPATLAPPLNDFCTAPTGVIGAVIRMRLTVNNAPAGIIAGHHWMYLDVPSSGAVVPAGFIFMPAMYQAQPVSQDITIRDTTISGGYNAADGFQSSYGASLVAWILG